MRDSDTQVDHVRDDGYVLAPSFTWRPSDDTRVTLLLNRQQDRSQVSAQFLPQVGTLQPGSLGFIGSERFVGEPGWDRYDSEKTETTLFVDQQLNDAWAFSATARYTNSSTETREHWVDIPSVPDANGEVNRTIFTADADTRILNLDARLAGEFALGATEHTLVAGIDRQDARWAQDNYSYVTGVAVASMSTSHVTVICNWIHCRQPTSPITGLSRLGFIWPITSKWGRW